MSQESKPNSELLVHSSHILGSDLQVKSHPQASLVKKHNVRYDHWHDTLIRACPKTTNNPRPNKTCITRRERLPNIGQHTYQSTYQNRRTSPKNVAERNNDEIGVSKGDSSGSE